MVTVNLGIDPAWAVAFAVVIAAMIKPKLAWLVTRTVAVLGVRVWRAAWPG